MSSATAVPASTADENDIDDDELVENTQWIDKRLNNLSAEESDTLKRIEQTPQKTLAESQSQQTVSERKLPTETVPPPPLLPALKHECSNLLCKTQPLPEKLSVCARCRQAQYCSKECQSQDWKKNHKQECTKLLEKVMSAPAMAPIVTAEPDIPMSTTATTESSSSSASSSSKLAEDEKSARRRELLAQSKARVTAKKSRDDQRRKVTTSGHSVPDLSSLMSGIQDTMKTMKSGEETNESKKEAFLKQTNSITSMLAKVMPTQQKQLTSIVNKLHGNMPEPSSSKPKKGKKQKKKKKNSDVVGQETGDPSSNLASSMELPPDD